MPSHLFALALAGLTFVTTGPAVALQDAKDSPAAEEKPARRPIEAADYGKWERLGFGHSLSPDGRWLAYTISRVDETSELRLRMLATDSTETVEYGSGAVFSRDGHWVAYRIGVSEDEREKLEKKDETPRNKLGLKDLVSGDKSEIEAVQSFAFSDDGHYLAFRRYPPKGRDSEGADLVVRHLSTGIDTGLGNVNEFAWADDVALLALTVDAEDKVGNGVAVFDPAAATLRTLDSANAHYRNLVWREDAADLAVLREVAFEEDEDVTHEVLAFQGIGDGKLVRRHFDPAAQADLQDEWRIVSFGGLDWSDDGRAVFLGLKHWDKRPKALDEKKDEEGDGHEGAVKADQKAGESGDDGSTDEGSDSKDGARDATKEGAGSGTSGKDGGSGKTGPDGKDGADGKDGKPGKDKGGKDEEADKDAGKSLRETLDEPAGVQVWHARDIDIIPLQEKTSRRNKERHVLAALHWEGLRLVHLARHENEDVERLDGDLHALALDNTPYEEEKRFGPTLHDVSLVDVASGLRHKILESNKYLYGGSPDGDTLLYIKGNHWWTYDTRTGVHRNLTADLSTPFINQEMSNLTDEKPPYGIAGWTEDGEQVVLYDRFDLWSFAMDGSAPRRLTRGAEDRVQYRFLDLDPDEDFWPAEGPRYLSVYGDRTKQSGFARLEDGAVNELVRKGRDLGRLVRAEDAPVFTYVEQDFDESPNIFVAGPDLKSPRAVTATNPFQSDYLWGRSELREYTNAHGEVLQASLYYPAGYEPGKQYPMITYIYELRSQAVHSYSVPTERHPYNPAVFTAQGYFWFQPDIVYRAQNPGLSAVECVVPAVQQIVKSGMIDPKRVGLVGHSWGGYQTAFLSTQTDVFAACVAGAPLTNMMSMSMSIYWNSGQTDAWIFHESQGRMDQPFWRDVETYIQNSPIFNIDRMTTPLLMAFGDKDGAVDWHQGIEFYNAARLAQKQFVLLVYEGENHSNSKKPNQVDYHHRVLEWFGHYLKGEAAPSWITEGVSYLDQQKAREEKSKKDGKGKDGDKD